MKILNKLLIKSSISLIGQLILPSLEMENPILTFLKM